MTTYKEIYGTNVEVLSSDPTNPVEGQIWYNSTSQTLKGYALVAGSWATAGPLNTARNTFSGSGTQTAGLVFGGFTTVNVGVTEGVGVGVGVKVTLGTQTEQSASKSNGPSTNSM